MHLTVLLFTYQVHFILGIWFIDLYKSNDDQIIESVDKINTVRNTRNGKERSKSLFLKKLV